MYSFIEKTLAVETYRRKDSENPYRCRTLSTLRKAWDRGPFDKEPVDYRYTMNDHIYRRYLKEGGVPATELFENSDEAAREYLNELRGQVEGKHEKLVLIESGYMTREPHMHFDDMTEHMNILWSQMDKFVMSPALYQAIKWLCNDTTLSTRFEPVSRKRSHNHCTYFSETMQYVLTTILLLCDNPDEKWPNDSYISTAIYELRLMDDIKNRKIVNINNLMLMLPEQLRLLAVGKPSEPGMFPEYPTDVWLTRLSDNQKSVLGVYSVQLDELGDRLLQPIDKGFPIQPFARDFPKFTAEAGDDHFITDFSYALRCYLNEVKEEEILKWDIEALELSVRSYNCLKRACIDTVADIISKSEQEMIKVRNLGRTSLDEVIRKITDLGLHLREGE
jgi:hypothetical protein